MLISIQTSLCWERVSLLSIVHEISSRPTGGLSINVQNALIKPKARGISYFRRSKQCTYLTNSRLSDMRGDDRNESVLLISVVIFILLLRNLILLLRNLSLFLFLFLFLLVDIILGFFLFCFHFRLACAAGALLLLFLVYRFLILIVRRRFFVGWSVQGHELCGKFAAPSTAPYWRPC